jgi:hypothetical protein
MKSSSDEGWAGMLLRLEFQSAFQRHFGPEQARDKVLEYLKREILAKDMFGVREVLMPGKNVEMFPRIKILIGDREEFLLTTTGLTVGEIRTSHDVPADWVAFVNDQPVADDYPVLQDCVLLFRLGVEEAMTGVCRAIRSFGYCQQREDSQNWISVSELRTTIENEKLQMLSEKELRTLFRREGIRTRKPSPQRLLVHCGDWLHFLVRQARQIGQALDANPDEIESLADAIREAGHRKRRIGGDD